ncbi:cryptochrome/photolyase family protein [Candidatus Neptunochlamydia vexilliferae]|uniref:cryptochrome/photolyase family protein n=1 Tax=Candidatus Neptunichlamydia vexilliferae TaxID=1651774 RepID=UPI0018918175|nr:deoxyribodipyrimidine photo-lyase [Candidatus Neptunochlamydia vexilliferae]
MRIVWFRQDLRCQDHPALSEAAQKGEVLPLYILNDTHPGKWVMGEASRLWLHHSLKALSDSFNGHLAFYKGDPLNILPQLIKETGAEGVYWNRCYEPWAITRDKKLKEHLKKEGLDVQSFNGSLLWEPWETTKGDGTPYKVFTPFYKTSCLKGEPPRTPLPKPTLTCAPLPPSSLTLNAIDLLPKKPWGKEVFSGWEPGEAGAEKRWEIFLKEGLKGYKVGRDLPAQAHVSRLSPHLHFGEISPHQLWADVSKIEEGHDTNHFLSELGWREFSHNLLYHFPSLPEKNLQEKFDRFQWKKDPKLLKAWQTGHTGYPFVDAGMRELYATGYMHNRMRMVVGSFLVKNLLLHWHEGEAWFWDCLFDADLANNSASWQWIGGCGADAAPYFRIFNPITQGEKFDPQGDYTRKYVPELAKLSDKYLFRPWEAPEEILEQAGIVLGKDYPLPIVDLKASREEALAAFERIKEK